MKIESVNLHGLSLDEAIKKTKINLDWCIQHGVDIIDINHGKGHHSQNHFSVLKSEIRKMLKEDQALETQGYRVIMGGSDFPVALTFDQGHTLIVAQGKENEYIGGKKQSQKNQAIFSPQGKQKRKVDKGIQARKRKRRRY